MIQTRPKSGSSKTAVPPHTGAEQSRMSSVIAILLIARIVSSPPLFGFHLVDTGAIQRQMLANLRRTNKSLELSAKVLTAVSAKNLRDLLHIAKRTK